MRRRVNRIDSLVDDSGNNLHSENDLFDAAVSYFAALFTTHGSSPAVEIIENIAPVISQSMNASLTRPFTKEEVFDLMLANPRRWNMELFQDHFTTDDIRLISSIPLSNVHQDDIMVWGGETKGEYSVRSGYRQLIRPMNPMLTNWTRPTEPFVKINFDAAFNASIEALAAIHGLRFALDLGCMLVVLESDSLIIISKLRSVVDDLSILRPYIADTRSVSQAFAYCRFAFTPRSGNEVAHCLAHLGKDSIVKMFWFEEVPPQASALVQADRRCSKPP
ncbi:hypothetical protein V6N11_049038 [Hibiscus sabdariffa]|uniref:RNase H type-1 domain-containing protein n=1 Tax=Hibiscus sabdariffa TaxID=183260 RepID=A0ABR2PX24_9ROSI